MQDLHGTLQIGKVIQERYRVEELLGQGGFGAVYLVKDLRVKGNVFALKEVVDTKKRERVNFISEGELLKRLDHPSLPRVYRTFEDDKNARAYILMDYIEGSNLEKVRKGQPARRLSLAQVLKVMEPIFEAVGYLHRQQPPIVHRDIKPSNIIVPGSGDKAVLVDFGIAKEYDMDATTTSIRLCSPGYGAPEQYASGTNPQTDIYGLAATFYALLAGNIPTDALQRMTQLGSKREDPLEQLHMLVPEIPFFISAAIERAMSIRSEERFATVEEFWQALHAQPFEAIPVTPLLPVVALSEQRPLFEPITPTVITRSTQISSLVLPPVRRQRIFVLALSIVVLIILLAGSIWGPGLLAIVIKPGHLTKGIVPDATAKSTIVPTVRLTQGLAATATLQATAPVIATAASVSTVAATVQPTVQSVPPVANYPVLASTYSGTISDKYTIPSTDSNMTLSQVGQNNGILSGYLQFGAGLIGSNTITGTVSTDKTIIFTLPSPGVNLLPLLFQGTIQGDRSISGIYCSYRGQNQCDKGAGGWGDWTVSPVS